MKQTIMVMVLVLSLANRAYAPPIPDLVIKGQFEKLSATAEVVAHVRVVAAVCSDVKGDEDNRLVSLQLALQILDAKKGPVRKNDVVVVRHQVSLRSRKVAPAYDYLNVARGFPFVPGVKGDVALRLGRRTASVPVRGRVCRRSGPDDADPHPARAGLRRRRHGQAEVEVVLVLFCRAEGAPFSFPFAYLH